MKTNPTKETAKLTAQALNTLSLVEYQPGSVVSRQIVKKPVGTVTLFAFDAGQGLSEHTAPFDALVMVIEGALTLTIGGSAVAATPGTVVRMPANVPHALEASTPTKMLLVMLRATA